MNGKPEPNTDFPMQPVIERLLSQAEQPLTLLGVGPMSPLIVETTLQMAAKFEFPVMFIASRNQVETRELGGGYVADTADFADLVHGLAAKTGFNGPLYLCRDHGGPWQRSDEKDLDRDQAWEQALISYRADIEAGFNLLHVDPTLHRTGASAPTPEQVIADTVRIVEYCETQAAGRSLSYEVGTEENRGEPISPERFESFIVELLETLSRQGLPLPSFIVGQTGSLVKMDSNVGGVNPASTARLTKIAAKYGLGFKEHNADYLPDFILKQHRSWGITACNVAPEFGVAETKACLDLADIEQQLFDTGDLADSSCFYEVLSGRVLAGGRWKKWLFPNQSGLRADVVRSSASLLRHITEVSGHYLFSDERVVEKRRTLMQNLDGLDLLNFKAEELVRLAVEKSIGRYVETLNLEGSNGFLSGN